MYRLSSRTACTIVLLALFAVPAQAKICVYRDADGHITYSNVNDSPPKDAKRIRCFEDPNPLPKQESSRPSSDARKPAARDPKTEAFPKVDGNTQRKRDDERRRILESELAAEQQSLDEAKQKLAAQESVRSGNESNYQRYLDRVQPYRDTVDNHERNIDAIRRELDNMR